MKHLLNLYYNLYRGVSEPHLPPLLSEKLDKEIMEILIQDISKPTPDENNPLKFIWTNEKTYPNELLLEMAKKEPQYLNLIINPGAVLLFNELRHKVKMTKGRDYLDYLKLFIRSGTLTVEGYDGNIGDIRFVKTITDSDSIITYLQNAFKALTEYGRLGSHYLVYFIWETHSSATSEVYFNPKEIKEIQQLFESSSLTVHDFLLTSYEHHDISVLEQRAGELIRQLELIDTSIGKISFSKLIEKYTTLGSLGISLIYPDLDTKVEVRENALINHNVDYPNLNFLNHLYRNALKIGKMEVNQLSQTKTEFHKGDAVKNIDGHNTIRLESVPVCIFDSGVYYFGLNDVITFFETNKDYLHDGYFKTKRT